MRESTPSNNVAALAAQNKLIVFTEVQKEIELEIVHVLFLDIVGSSRLSVNEQHARIAERKEQTGF